jgi:CDP-glucose 4,6-dehydratase
MGTGVLLETLRSIETVKAIVVVSSDKCYQNSEIHLPFQESDPLGGLDPYSASKACVEIVTNCYRQSFFQQNCFLASARAGNVIGGGDWSEDRLIPDFVRANIHDKIMTLRYPQAIRPWQHVIDPLYGYLLLLMKLYKKETITNNSFNFGPKKTNNKSVNDVINLINKDFKNSVRVIKKIKSSKNYHESKILMLNSDKSKKILNWQTKYNLEQSIKLTSFWFKEFIAKKNILKLTQNQINNYFH